MSLRNHDVFNDVHANIYKKIMNYEHENNQASLIYRKNPFGSLNMT
jgi:hypothetical protein